MLKHPKEAFHSNFVSLDCDQGSMVTQHGKPMFTQVSNPDGCGMLKHLSLIPFLLPKLYSAVPQGGILGRGQIRRGQGCHRIQQAFTELVYDHILGHRGTYTSEEESALIGSL